jgi:large subunit ribosomal protein L24
MQKLIQRTKKAERQVLRRSRERTTKQFRLDRMQRMNGSNHGWKDFRRNVTEARTAARERWTMGAIAPDRAVVPTFGVSSTENRLAHSVVGWTWPSHEVEARCAWAGGSKQLNLRVGDRVVIMEGRDKGLIDVVDSLDMPSGTLTLHEHGKVGLEAFHKRVPVSDEKP